ncbi:hypothetical protein [Paenibacillus sp. XY044]|uniref:hypothetical protein n=1 Tax=Paenibacillus sp. XY044 TaxID=2026089 RepID=UPI000B99C01F|nr:hypothetical protein [Paenibacillus sp. XY044]OZB90453.1 hypothetical protein CJP46_33370 [Paenibacillus sp. XY044]
MTRQRIKSGIITGIVIVGIVFLYGIFYFENIPSGILLRAGITKSNVVMSADSNSFRHYFIMEKGEPAGIMTLQREGKLWSKYYYSRDVSISKSSPNITLLKSYQPLYIDNAGKTIPVWGGSVSAHKDEYQSVKIRIHGNIKDPASSIKKDGRIYFFYLDPNMSIDENIEILPQK